MRITSAFVGKLDEWFTNVVPLKERPQIAEAKTALRVNAFRSYWIPVDSVRIDAFLQQFAKPFEWVGEAVLDIVPYYDERFFVNALSSLVQLNKWETGARLSFACLAAEGRAGLE